MLIRHPMTDAPRTLDAFETQQLLAAANSSSHVCAMHPLMLEVMHRRFKCVQALLHAVQSAQQESKTRIPELREYMLQAPGLFTFSDPSLPSGYGLSKAELDMFYHPSGAGPLCALFIQELLDRGRRELRQRSRRHGRQLHARFIERRNTEIALLRSVFRGRYDVRQLFGKNSGDAPNGAMSGVRVTDTELSQLLLAGDTGAGVMIHIQHASLPGHEQLSSIGQLHHSFSFGVSAGVKQSILGLLRDSSSDLLKPSATATSWTLDHVERLLAQSNAGSDAFMHLWALRAATAEFDGLESLAAAVHSGRIGCLDPVRRNWRWCCLTCIRQR
jgi:hypothetical protein